MRTETPRLARCTAPGRDQKEFDGSDHEGISSSLIWGRSAVLAMPHLIDPTCLPTRETPPIDFSFVVGG